MKTVLITGKGSYIGESFKQYICDNYREEYEVDTVDMLSTAWKEKDFSSYDAIFHVAGIAHIKETKENAENYYKVNRDLTLEVAKKAKADGVEQFIFLSSMSVYGLIEGEITADTPIKPNTHYGKSKYEAEKILETLADSDFCVTIIRPPMVYGKGCKGNFNTVVKLVKKLPVFPKLKNRRSMIYIDNLSEFVKLIMDKKLSGVYCPQNSEYMSTSDMAMDIATVLGKKIYFSRLLGLLVILIKPFVSIAKKAFGNLIYKINDDYDFSFCKVGNEDSVKKSV